MFSNPETAGLGFFEKYLNRAQLNPKNVPDQLKIEIVNLSIDLTNYEFGNKQRTGINRISWNKRFEANLEANAAMLSLYIKDKEAFRDTFDYVCDLKALEEIYQRYL